MFQFIIVFENCIVWHLRGKYLLTLELLQNVVFYCEVSLDFRLLLMSVEIRFSPGRKLLVISFYIFNLLLKVIFSLFILCYAIFLYYQSPLSFALVCRQTRRNPLHEIEIFHMAIHYANNWAGFSIISKYYL